MTAAPVISIVDDDDSLRNSLNNLIRSVGFGVQGFSSAEAFLKSNQLHDTMCLILDVRMPGMSGRISSVSWLRPIVEFRSSSSRHMQMTTRERGHLKPARWTFYTNPSGRRRCLMRSTQLSSPKRMEGNEQNARNSKSGANQTGRVQWRASESSNERAGSVRF